MIHFGLVIAIAISASTTSVNTESGLTVPVLEKRELVTSWGERTSVYLTDRFLQQGQIEDDSAKVVAAKVLKDNAAVLSLPAIQHMIRTENIATVESVLKDESVPLNKVVSTVLGAAANSAAKAGKCSFTQVVNTMVTDTQLEKLRGPSKLPLVARVSSIGAYFRKLSNADHCAEMLPDVLYSFAINSDGIFSTDRYSGWYALAVLQDHLDRNCGVRLFVPSNVAPEVFRCVQTLTSLPKEIDGEDIFLPIAGFGLKLLPTAPSSVGGWYSKKLIEAGVYDPEIRVAIPSPVSKRRVSLTLEGTLVGEFNEAEVNSLLLAAVKIGSCRDLLTREGVRRYCIKELKPN